MLGNTRLRYYLCYNIHMSDAKKLLVDNFYNDNNTCLYCGKKTELRKDYPQLGYSRFCCQECRNKYKVENSSYYKFVSNKNWLYEQRIVLRKSKEKIAQELGCSVTVINKWLKIHNITKVKYNESEYSIKKKLEDKSFLESEYITNRKTCQEIADDIGSTKNTVSLALHSHDITIRNPNDYEREFHRMSQVENEIFDFIHSLIPDVEILRNTRTVLCGNELDIYVPSFNLAIEVDGAYYHSEIFKDKNYHLRKSVQCQEKGIQLIHILDVEWKLRKDVWKNFLRNKLNKNEVKIHARKCRVVKLDAHTKNLFLEENHLQGKDKSSVKLGLEFNGHLVSVITFKKSRFNQNYQWELVRFCSLHNTNVVGGFSKLLKHFIKTYNPESIITYADRSYSLGNLYAKNGFDLLKKNNPSFCYLDKKNGVLINRMNATKRILSKKAENHTMSESELAVSLGLVRVWNCGTLTFVWKKSND